MKDKTSKKNYHADQDATASYTEGPGKDPTNVSRPKRTPRKSTFARGTRAQRNERFGEECS